MSNETGKSGETGRRGFLDWLEQASLVLAALCLAGVVASQAWQVFARYVLNNSPSWTEPMALVLIGVTATLGAAVGVRRETHFSFPTLADALPPALKAACRLISRLAMLALGAGLAWYGFVLATDAWDVPMAGAPIGVGARFAPIALGGALIAIFAAERIVRSMLDKPSLAKPADIGEDA